MNDNRAPDQREKLIGRVLASAVAIEEHLTTRLAIVLNESGCTAKYQEIIREFIKPALAILGEMEGQVIQQIRKEQIAEMLVADTIESQAIQLESYAGEFARLANTPQQMKLAVRFRHFIDEITHVSGKEPEMGREPRKPERDHER